MKIQQIKYLVLTLLFALGVNSAEREGEIFAETLDFEGQTLRLNGRLGLRKKFFFKVYVAGLYVKEPQKDEKILLSDNHLKLIEMRFLRDVDKPRISSAWEEGLQATCGEGCDSAKQMTTFESLLRDLREKERLRLIFKAGSVELWINEESRGKVEDPNFARDVLNIFISPKTHNPELRKDLLGLS